jgi:putative tryptophan/tyrosine transport system substrate-binding protein
VRRRELIALMGAAVTWPFAAMAQDAGRTYRIGSLYPAQQPDVNTAFFDDTRRHGFIEGKNLQSEFRSTARHPDRLSEYVADLLTPVSISSSPRGSQ